MDKSELAYERLRERGYSAEELDGYSANELVKLERRGHLLYHVLNQFNFQTFSPSRGILERVNEHAEPQTTQRELTELLAAISNDHLVYREMGGTVLHENRLLEKHPESGRQSATYRLTALGLKTLHRLFKHTQE